MEYLGCIRESPNKQRTPTYQKASDPKACAHCQAKFLTLSQLTLTVDIILPSLVTGFLLNKQEISMSKSEGISIPLLETSTQLV